MVLPLIIFYAIIAILVLAIVGINAKNLYHHSCEGKLGVPSAIFFMLTAIAFVVLGAISLTTLINSI